MNTIITYIEQLPYSVTENIDYHLVQVILLYGVIACVCYLLYQRNRKVFWMSAVLFTLFCSSFVVKKVFLSREVSFLAYHIRKSSALEFNFHGQAILFADSIFSVEDKLYRYNVRNHARRHHLHVSVVPLDTLTYDTPFLCKRGNFIRFESKNYYILTRDQRVFYNKDEPLTVDCLLLHQNPRALPEELMENLPFREVIADGSNTPFYISRWRIFCQDRGIPFTFTGERKF